LLWIAGNENIKFRKCQPTNSNMNCTNTHTRDLVSPLSFTDTFACKRDY